MLSDGDIVVNTERTSNGDDLSIKNTKMPDGEKATATLIPRSSLESAVGLQELKIVSAVEDAFTAQGRYHIHVIKSREISNARSFYAKVSRILKLHGYNVRTVTKADLENETLGNFNEKTTVFVMEEDLFAGFQDTGSSPLAWVLSRQAFSSIGKINLILVVSDAFYERLSESIGEITSRNRNEGSNTVIRTSESHRDLIAPGILIIALSFLVAALYGLVISYILPSGFANIYTTATQILMVVFTLAGVALISLSVGQPGVQSQRGVFLALIFFIALFAFAVFGTSIKSFTTLINSNFVLLLLLNLLLLGMFIAKFPLMISASRSKLSYALSVAGGIILSGFIIFNRYLTSLFQSGNFPISVPISSGLKAFVSGIGLVLASSGFPAFGLAPQNEIHYAITNPLEYIPLAGNILIFSAYIVAYGRIRRQRL